MSISPLNRTSAAQILQLCALCFKRGVLDAYEFGDDYAAREFLESHSENWTYGVLGEPDDYDWKMWRYSLYRWCRSAKLVKFAETYLYEVKRFNYLFCPIVFSMRFYLMGISEWLDYPNPVGIERFKQERSRRWKPDGFMKLTRTDIISDMQKIAYDYRRRPEEEQTVRDGVMIDFVSAMFDMTSRYVFKKKVIIDGEEIKNIKA